MSIVFLFFNCPHRCSKEESFMAKRSDVTKAKRTHAERPLSYEKLLMQENVPASEPVPPDVAEIFAKKSIFIRSDDPKFDPRSCFAKIKGAKGTWEFSTTEAMVIGLPVETGRLKPGSLGRSQKRGAVLKAFRPPWQSYAFHPRPVRVEQLPQMLQRKSGQKIRPDAVFNRDDRDLFYPEGYPWQCIGRLFVSSQTTALATGTATLVGRRTVLTSSHMIPWGAPGMIVLFVPAFWNWPFPWTPFMPVIPPPLQMASIGTDVWGYQQGKRQAYDLALVRLREPLGDRLGYFGCTIYDDDWEDDTRWTLVGYPGLVNVAPGPAGITGYNNNGNMPTRQFGISVEDDDSDAEGLELEHRADTTGGNSGGPLFGFWPDGAHVIGVHSGGNTDTNVAAGGRAMWDLVNWARNTWV
jgi:V8-like Glu-specific endopeptidase